MGRGAPSRLLMSGGEGWGSVNWWRLLTGVWLDYNYHYYRIIVSTKNGSGSWKGICASERFGANMVECEWLSWAGSPSSRLTNGYPPTLSLPTLHITQIYPPYTLHIPPHTFTHPHHHKQCTYSWVPRTTGWFKLFAHALMDVFLLAQRRRKVLGMCATLSGVAEH